MKKLVNGKVVDIKNIELFEKAEEGLAIQRKAVSLTSEALVVNIDNRDINKCISAYNYVYKSMAYPLYAIESDIKYATIANFIKAKVNKNIKMWVDRGLYIVLDGHTGKVLYLVGNTWSIKTMKETLMKDNTSLKLYEEETGYEEYNWLLNAIVSGSTENFYSKFMKDFVEACNGQAIVLKWELENMLTFASIPEEIKIDDNVILDAEKGRQYKLDIYSDGYIDTGDNGVMQWSLGANGRIKNNGTRSNLIKKYGYEVHQKENINEDSRLCKDKKVDISIFNPLFLMLCALKNNNREKKFRKFRGYIQLNNIMFQIDNNIYMYRANKDIEARRIATNAELYSIKGNTVYFLRKEKVDKSIDKVFIYGYNMTRDNVKLCKILYTY